MQITSSHKSFILGISISVLVLVSFFGGALADRIFVIKPLDVVVGRRSLPVKLFAGSQANNEGKDTAGSRLSSLVRDGAVNDVADVAEVSSESVVTVSIKKQQRVLEAPSRGDIFGFGLLPFGGSVRTEEVQQDIGTGFVVENSLIVTNKHVVGDPEATYKVIDKNDKEYEVKAIYRDPSIDMAILRVEGLEVAPSELGNSDELRVGQGVIAIGTALGEFRHTVTTGVVSGLGRGIEATDGFGLENLEGVIQTDAAINPGNSGGPLLNLAGQVIGVNVAVSAAGQNIGFAIPINVVKSAIENFNETGQFERPFLGIRYQMISEQAALMNEVPQGAYLIEVIADSSAAAAGLQEGDIITEFNGVKLSADENLAALINKLKIGQQVAIVYWRGEAEKRVTVTLKGQ
jgi:S1-C subfamily serine protease